MRRGPAGEPVCRCGHTAHSHSSQGCLNCGCTRGYWSLWEGESVQPATATPVADALGLRDSTPATPEAVRSLRATDAVTIREHGYGATECRMHAYGPRGELLAFVVRTAGRAGRHGYTIHDATGFYGPLPPVATRHRARSGLRHLAEDILRRESRH